MRLLRSLLIILSVSFCVHTASGQSIKGAIVAGFGGFYRIGKCMPIIIHLDNSGRDLTGKLVIQLSHTSLAQTVTLPSPSRKKFVSYVVPPKYFHELEVKLFADGKILKVFNSSVQRVSDDEMLVVKSSTLRQVLSSNNGPSVSSRNEKTTFLDPEDFPESWNDYEAVNSVVLDVSDTTRLSNLQRTALARWTLLGGSVTLLNRGSIADAAKQTGKAISPRTVLGLGSFGEKEETGQDPATVYQPSLPDLDEEVFKTVRVRNSIPRAGITWSLGIFLLLYGCTVAFCTRIPRNSEKRKLWNLAAIPVIAVMFSGLCPWISLGVNAGGTMIRQYSVAHVFPNSADTFTTNDISLLFARKSTCRLRPAIPSSYLVQNESENTTDPIYYEFQGKGVPSAAFQTDLWRTRLLSLASFSGPGPFLLLRNVDFTVLANRSKFHLRNCRLIRYGESMPLGDIQAGHELRLKLESFSDSNSPSRLDYSPAMLSRTIDVYQTETLAGMTGDCVICAMDGIIRSLESESAELSYTGSTAVIYHLGKHPAEASKLDKK